jgi:uncharacterized protein (PEP-CTERM system associated)
MAAMVTTAMNVASSALACTGKRTPLALSLLMLGAFATHPIAGMAQTWRITPRVSLNQTYTDNVEQASDAQARNAWVTEATPSIRIEGTGSRANFFLDYQLRNFVYSGESRLNNSQKQLTSALKVEAIEKWFFIDTQANITQQNRSPFATSVDTGATNVTGAGTNRVETRTYQIAPYVRGRVSDIANYLLRYNITETRTNDLDFPNTRLNEWAGRLSNASAAAKLGWSIDASALSLRNSGIGTRNDERLRGTLIYAFEPQLRFSVIGGKENTDYASVDKRSTNIYGAGIEWSPSPRTQVAAVREHRFFGDGYSALLTHRTPRTAWRFSTSNDVSALPTQLSAIDPGSVYSSLYELLQSTIRDPAERARAVQARLAQTGIPIGSSVGSSFLTTRPFVSRTREASVAMLGNLNTVTLNYSRRDQRSFGLGLGNTGGGAGEDVRRESTSIAWAYRLTPLSTMTLFASRLRSDSLSFDRTRSTQYVETLSWSRPLGPRMALTAGFQHVDFKTTANDGYKENFVFANLSYRF